MSRGDIPKCQHTVGRLRYSSNGQGAEVSIVATVAQVQGEGGALRRPQPEPLGMIVGIHDFS